MFDVIGIDVSTLPHDELVAALKDLETRSRQLVAARVRLDAELDSRGIPYELGYSSTAAMLSDVLRLGPGEARSRARLARGVGPRRTITGQAVEPALPLVARALERADISARHAEVVLRTVDHIPDHVLDDPDPAALAAQAEATLLEHAQTMDPVQLAAVGRRLIECLDPDGQLESERAQQRRRDVTLTVEQDGSGRLSGWLTAQATAVWMTVLGSLSAPAPAADRTPDHRTAAQRRHDGLLDAGL